MTSYLPTPLSCITLSHIINDVNAVEGYLSQDPRAADCFPLILRDLFFTNERNMKWELSNLGTPNASTTSQYLRGLWCLTGYPMADVVRVSKMGLIYILPYLVPDDINFKVDTGEWRTMFRGYPESKDEWQRTLTLGLESAAKSDVADAFDTVRLLHRMGASTAYMKLDVTVVESGIADILENTAKRGDVKMVLTLLKLEPLVENHNVVETLKTAVRHGDIRLIEAVVLAYPEYFTSDVWTRLRHLAGLHLYGIKKEKTLDWLDDTASRWTR